MRVRTVLWVVIAAVGIALLPTLPYGYYLIMRWIVCASSAWLALSSYRSGREDWTWIWGVIAGVYNPIFPVHANREIWSIVNLATIAVAAWYGLKVLRFRSVHQDGGKS